MTEPTEPKPEAGAESALAAKPRPESEVEVAPASKLEPTAEPVRAAKPKPEPRPAPESAAKLEPGAKPKPGSTPKSKSELKPGSAARPKPARLRAHLHRFVTSTMFLSVLVGLLCSLTLLRSEGQIGYVRDEGVYFEASRHYAAWVVRWLDEGEEANTPEVRDRYFAVNHEHPALMKLAAGLSARLLAEPPNDAVEAGLRRVKGKKRRAWRRELAAVEGGKFPLMREGKAMRLPAILLTGLGAGLLFWTGRRLGDGVLGGLLAAGYFVLIPRVAFHASLHTFDVPIAIMTLILALAWLRALSDWRWGLAMGPLLGVAVAVKHNALFLGPLFALHLLVCLGLRWWVEGERPRVAQLAPMALVNMAIVGPLVALMLWPWMWDDTLTRLGEYIAFHGEHSYYNMEFWGHNYNRPPLPILYPFVMTLATVPGALLLLSAVGLLLSLRTLRTPRALRHLGRFGDNRRRPTPMRVGARPRKTLPPDTPGLPQPSWIAPVPLFTGREEPLLYLGLALFPLLLIALPSIPIFGGTKHWLTAYPFFALLAAMAWGRLWWRARILLQRTRPKLMRRAPVVVLAMVLAPGAWATAHGHPYNLSQYAPLAGGARGAASAGLNRGFWGHSVVALLDEVVLDARRVYLHDIHPLAVEQYRREGRWPGWQPSSIGQAEVALLFPEQHMLSEEIEIWGSFGTVQPAMVLTLDDVPITIVYRR